MSRRLGHRPASDSRLLYAPISDRSFAHSVTKTALTEPWRALPPSVADVIEPELDAITDEILAAIAREVPEYARPLEGSFGRGVRTGVTRGAAPVRRADPQPDRRPRPGREVYVGARARRAARGPHARRAPVRLPGGRAGGVAAALGRGRGGRARRARAEPPRRVDLRLHRPALRGLGRGLRRGALAARGRAPAARRELIALLVRDPPAEEADAARRGGAAGWSLPRAAAALACGEDDLDRIARAPAAGHAHHPRSTAWAAR